MHTPGGPIFPTNYLSTEFIDRMALINHEHDPISFHEHVGPNPTFFLVFTIAQRRARRGCRDEKKTSLICYGQ
jgi:hypothetical protein